MNKSMVKIDPRGDDIKCFQEIIKLIPSNREDLLSYICYLQNEFLEQLGIDKKPYDISLWSDEEIDKFFDTGINPFLNEEKATNNKEHSFNETTKVILNNIKDNGFYGIIKK